MEFHLSYFKSEKMILWKCCAQISSMPANLEYSVVATELERSVFIQSQRNNNAKECSNYCTIALISHTSKVMLKILQARLQQYMNRECPDVQAGFRKGKGTRESNCQHPLDHRKSKSSRKTSTSASLTILKPLTVWITTTVEKSERDANTRPSDLPLEKCVCRLWSNT